MGGVPISEAETNGVVNVFGDSGFEEWGPEEGSND